MRHYRTNSPQAAARIVALTLVADGHVSRSELDVLEQLDGYRLLGLTSWQMNQLLQHFCEDLLATGSSHWGDAAQFEPQVIDQLMAEVDEPDLRDLVRHLCTAIVHADGHVADGESMVLARMAQRWPESQPARLLSEPC